MAICRWAGYPDLFVTFTCNAAWPEIQSMLHEVQQTAWERPDIVDRVFHIKLKEFMRDIREREYFGKTLASNNLQTSSELLFFLLQMN
jgi:hypothetical protein